MEGAVMADLDLLDCHSHLFATAEEQAPFLRFLRRSELAGKVLLNDALAYMKKAGIRRLNMVLLTPSGMLFHEQTKDLPPTPEGRQRAQEARRQIVERVISYNEWGVRVCQENPQLSCFLGLDPVLMDENVLLAELEDKTKKGARGVKLAPIDYCAFFNDRRHWPIYDYCQSRDLPLFVYAGGAYCLYTARLEQWAHPRALFDVLKEFPHLRLCCAHMSRGTEDAFLELARSYTGVMGELSHVLSLIGQEGFREQDLVTLIRKVGSERVLFGVNFGTTAPDVSYQQVEAFRRLPLTERERELIGEKNFGSFIGD
jgi:predicted TIM-barrel fold metal-dependent hydrolase